MTATRRERKSCRPRLAGLLFAIVVAAVLDGGMTTAGAVTTELVAANRHTGLAIDGFDPVAYFTDGMSDLGRPELEVRYAGATWRFRNEGNRAAFAASPASYVPAFGGHDPVAIARGAATHGHPQIWIIVADRLYLFFDDVSLAAFQENPELAIAAAVRQWPEVLRKLSP